VLGVPEMDAEAQCSDVAKEGQARRHTATLQMRAAEALITYL